MVDHLDWSQAVWRKAIASDSSGCVEVATLAGVIGVRDTKDHGEGPILTFSAREWEAFLHGARAGEFDLPVLEL